MSTGEPSKKSASSSSTQRSAEIDSEQPTEVQRENSVFDFLYNDARRTAAFLSQFHAYGALAGVKSVESVGSAATTKATAKAGGGIPAVFSGEVAIDENTTDDTRDATEQTFDPLWKNATTLLNYLESNELIVRNIRHAKIGQFVLMTGNLAAFDLAIFQQMFKLPAIRKMIIAGAKIGAEPKNRHERLKQAKTKGPSGADLDTSAMLDMLGVLPHTVQGTVSSDEHTAWFTLRSDSMVTNPAELLLKHGIAIEGQWSVLGVLDANPADDEVSGQLQELDQITAAASLGGMIAHMHAIAPATRMTIGRPSTAFGLTPVMIFREVF